MFYCVQCVIIRFMWVWLKSSSVVLVHNVVVFRVCYNQIANKIFVKQKWFAGCMVCPACVCVNQKKNTRTNVILDTLRARVCESATEWSCSYLCKRHLRWMTRISVSQNILITQKLICRHTKHSAKRDWSKPISHQETISITNMEGVLLVICCHIFKFK